MGPRCFGCDQLGHLRRDCPREHPRPGPPAARFQGPATRPAAHYLELEDRHRDDDSSLEVFGTLYEANPLQAAREDNRRHHQQTVWVNGRLARGLRDTGATITLVRPSLAAPDDRTGRNIAVRVAGGSIVRVPTAQVHLDWGSNARTVEVGLMGQLPTEVLLGNDLGGLTSAFNPVPALEAMPVTTRQQARRQEARIQEITEVKPRPDPLPDSAPLSPDLPAPDTQPDLPPPTPLAPYSIEWATPERFTSDLHNDPSLRSYRELADTGTSVKEGEHFEWDRGLLYRVSSWKGTPRRQLVVPRAYRPELLRLAHDIPLAGHMGITKTIHRVTQKFFWPGIHPAVRQYCQSCDVCQRVGKHGDRPRAPLHPLPIIEEPFSRVAVDLVGPLPRPSPSGKKYILTVVDYATRYPEAVPLSNIHAETVADALLKIFSRVGFPREILSDRGTQFMAEVTQQLWHLCNVQSLHSAPYHPQTNGLCERFNGTLKQLLRTFTLTHKDWEKYLPHLLFAYREVPQESTGFSPFELLYGRRVRGPLDLLRDHWEGHPEGEGDTVIGYVLAFRDRLKVLTDAVRTNLHTAQTRQKVWYDRTARNRTLQVGDKVLALKPTKQDRLQAAWHGPYKVVRQLHDTTYLVARCSDERVQRTFHVNMLKAYQERPEEVAAICAPATDDPEDLPLPDIPGPGGDPQGASAVHP